MSAANLHTGCEAFKRLMAELQAMSNAACMADEAEEGVDTRDYRAMAERIRASILANLLHDDPAHAEGYLRAITDLLSIIADGCAPDVDGAWYPLDATALAFDSHSQTVATISRAAH